MAKDILYIEHYNLDAELIIDDWLDFIRALYKLRIDKWKDNYGNLGSIEWNLMINVDLESGEEDSKYSRNIYGYDLLPPNWNEFKKLMYGMVEKIRERNIVKEKAE